MVECGVPSGKSSYVLGVCIENQVAILITVSVPRSKGAAQTNAATIIF